MMREVMQNLVSQSFSAKALKHVHWSISPYIAFTYQTVSLPFRETLLYLRRARHIHIYSASVGSAELSVSIEMKQRR
jgi:hypothetical protein